MDVKKIGEFLAQLRRERNLTQEQLGEQLGVTNKTVSRWENGNYLPPVEMLQDLSVLYGVSINELLSGERLSDAVFREKAEENVKAALEGSFTLEEKIAYFKEKWKKDHRSSLIAAVVIFAGLHLWGLGKDSMVLQLIATVFAFVFAVVRYNAMMIYVEGNAFDPPLQEARPRGELAELRWKRLRITGLILLGASVLVCTDLACNYFSALVPQLNDGITVRGIIAPLIFGLDGIHWSLANFCNGFVASLKALSAVGIGNIILTCAASGRKPTC